MRSIPAWERPNGYVSARKKARFANVAVVTPQHARSFRTLCEERLQDFKTVYKFVMGPGSLSGAVSFYAVRGIDKDVLPDLTYAHAVGCR